MCAVGGVDVPALLSVEIMPVKPFIKRQNAKKSGAAPLSKNQLLLGADPVTVHGA